MWSAYSKHKRKKKNTALWDTTHEAYKTSARGFKLTYKTVEGESPKWVAFCMHYNWDYSDDKCKCFTQKTLHCMFCQLKCNGLPNVNISAYHVFISNLQTCWPWEKCTWKVPNGEFSKLRSWDNSANDWNRWGDCVVVLRFSRGSFDATSLLM